MLDKSESLAKSILLVSIGAIAGSWLRMRAGIYFKRIAIKKYWGTLSINMIATFFLGLILALEKASHHLTSIDQSKFNLLISIGFLGSLSTFSTFSVELLEIINSHNWKELIFVSVICIFGGLISAAAGYRLGYA